MGKKQTLEEATAKRKVFCLRVVVDIDYDQREGAMMDAGDFADLVHEFLDSPENGVHIAGALSDELSGPDRAHVLRHLALAEKPFGPELDEIETEQALKEGWFVAEGERIEADDEQEWFSVNGVSRDDLAIEHVRQHARGGSALHQKALLSVGLAW